MRPLRWLILLGLVAIAAAAGYRWYSAHNSPARRHYLAGERQLKAGRTDLAGRHWQIAIALDPRLVEAREALGRLYFSEGALALAIREFETVTRLQPRRDHAYCQLAEALQAGSVTEYAFDSARYAVRTEPRCARARRTLGVLYSDRQDHRAALKELTEAARLDPKDAALKLTLARLQLRLSRLAEAEVQARAARDLRPDDPTAAYLLGHILVERADPARAAEAEELLRAAVAAMPNDPPARRDLGRVYTARGRPLAARWELERALQLAPRDPVTLQQLAGVYAALKEPGRAEVLRTQASRVAADTLARQELERQLTQRPLDGTLMFRLGTLYARDGEYLQAITMLERAQDLLYADPTVRRRLEEVRAQAARTSGTAGAPS